MKQHWYNVIFNVEPTLKRHCATMKNGYIDIVQRWFNVFSTLDTDIVSMLCNVENPTSDFVSFSTSDQCYLNGDPQWWNNVDTTLKCWQGSIKLAVSMKKLILRNNLPATLLTKWNLWVFFKDYAQIFTTSFFANFFWWLLLRIRLRLVVSNRSGLLEVPS